MNRGHAPWLFATCVLGVLSRSPGPDTCGRHRGDPALHSCGPLAFSNKNGRELLPMLKYSARAQLQLGALLAVVLVFQIGL